MKASDHFVSTLANGIRLLGVRFGVHIIEKAPRWAIFHKVADAVSPGARHNADIDMPEDAAWHAERMALTDAHIETAIKAAMARIYPHA